MNALQMLQDPAVKRTFEGKIIAHINAEYMKAGMSPPLPKIRDNMAFYDEENVTKLANRIRTGAVLFAKLLDELNAKKEGSNA